MISLKDSLIKKRIVLIAGVAGLVLIAVITACDLAVSHGAEGRMFDCADSVPHREVGLVLGTSPVSAWNGCRNLYFDCRIKAAAELYNSGKVDWLIVSGGDYRDTEANGYDEPVAMRDSLIKQGVPSKRIILDYDGTRTLKSITKVRDFYRKDSIIIISQEYHNERALYQAEHLGVNAIAYNAETPEAGRSVWLRNRGREIMARVKLFIDLSQGVEPAPLLTSEHISTPQGTLICLKPDMRKMRMELVCGSIPEASNDSIMLAFAGAFTGKFLKVFKHINIASDHVSGGVRYKGYVCKRNTGLFTWSEKDGARFFYLDGAKHLETCVRNGGMAFYQEMMIHEGKAVTTTRTSINDNVFRALCLDAHGDLAVFETGVSMKFGDFIKALLSQGVIEALYTDMGSGWNYCFYRRHANEPTPTYLHKYSTPYSTNFVVIRMR